MKKLAFLAVFVMAFALMGGAALAVDSPHGPFADDTSLCSACHRAHTAQAEYLISDVNTITICVACHDGSGADTNVKLGVYVVNGSWVSSASGTRPAATLLNGATVTDGDALDDTIVVDSTTGYLAGEEIAIGAPAGAPAVFEYATIVSVTDATTLVVTDLASAHSDNDIVGNASASALDHETWGTASSPMMGGGFEEVLTTATSSSHIASLTNSDNTKWGIQFGEQDAPGESSATLTLTCVSCHIPHRSANYRMLRQAPQGLNSDDIAPMVVGDNFTRAAGGSITSNHNYTEDIGLYNLKRTADTVTRGGGPVPNDGISAWCGACHDYYYDNASKDSGNTAPATPTATTLDVDATAAETVVTVTSETGAVVNGSAVFEDGTNKASRVITAVAAGQVTLKTALGFDFAAAGTTVTFTGRGVSGAYYDIDGDLAAEAGYMHSVDVDMVYLPRNGSNGTVDLDLWSNLDENTYANRLPVASDDGTGYANDNEMNCVTCHRAHGTEAIMEGPAAIGVTARLGTTGLQGTADDMADSVLLRLPNRGVCETCHQMPTGY